MFTFLTRIGRLFVVTLVFATTASILGFGILNYSPVANKHAAGTAACVVSAAGVGSALTISGSGYAPGGSYAVQMTWPYGGVGDLLTTADASGAILVTSKASWSGTYKASILNSRGTAVASCSTTV